MMERLTNKSENTEEIPRMRIMKCKMNDCFSCPYPDCINDYIPPRRERTPEHKAKCAKKKKEKYAAMKNAGICVRCHNRPARQGHVMCAECNNLHSRLHREKARATGNVSREEMDGVDLCVHCGKHPPLCGHKVCEICYASCLKSLSAANVARAEKKVRG